MNTPIPEMLLRQPSAQESLPLATSGVQRWVWESRYGEILIEVIDGVAYVNSARVEPFPPGTGLIA